MRPFFKLYDTPRPKFEKLDRLNALKLLSTISNDPNLLKRDLNSSNSFSAISMEFRKEVKLKIEKIAELDKNSIFNLDHIIGVRSNSLIGDEICESEKWK